MKIKSNEELKVIFDNLKKELLKFIKYNKDNIPADGFRVYFYLLEKIDTIMADLNNGKHVTNTEIKYPELTRAIIELPTSLMSPELGGKIIEAEKYYITNHVTI